MTLLRAICKRGVIQPECNSAGLQTAFVALSHIPVKYIPCEIEGVLYKSGKQAPRFID